MKRLFASLLFAAVIISALCGYAIADETPVFKVSSVQAEPGETVDITVSTVNNPGIASFEFTIEYDPDVLEWTDVRKGALEGLWSLEIGTDAIWINSDNYSDDSVILVLSFRVKDKAPTGMSEISLSYLADNVFNEREENVSFDIISGGVDVIGGQSHADNEEKTDTSPTPARGSEPTADSNDRAVPVAGTESTIEDEPVAPTVQDSVRPSPVDLTGGADNNRETTQNDNSRVTSKFKAEAPWYLWLCAAVCAAAVILAAVWLIRKRKTSLK